MAMPISKLNFTIKEQIAWAFSVMVIPAFRYNLFSIALGLNPRQLKKGFPLQSGLNSFCLTEKSATQSQFLLNF
jgi:hypothetical protein